MFPFFKVAVSCTLYMAQLSTPYMYVVCTSWDWRLDESWLLPVKEFALCPVAQTGRRKVFCTLAGIKLPVLLNKFLYF